MAGTVLNRVVFVEQMADGFFRFANWALATTKLGVMAEPFNVQQVPMCGDEATTFDATDDMSLITTIKMVNSDLVPTMISGGGPSWCGGSLMPRTGR